MDNEMTVAQIAMQDAAFRARAYSAVSQALSNFKDRGSYTELTERDLHDVALAAVVLALKQAFDNDAEISRLRAENEHYKAAYLRIAPLAPLSIPVQPLKETP